LAESIFHKNPNGYNFIDFINFYTRTGIISIPLPIAKRRQQGHFNALPEFIYSLFIRSTIQKAFNCTFSILIQLIFYFCNKKGRKMHLSELTNILKQRRNQLGITQNDLAELSGIALRTIKLVESGKNNPTLDTVIKLAEVLGMEIKLEIKQPKI
jgi:y4mF family transcriptional regulator